jgi:hypothetical protein
MSDFQNQLHQALRSPPLRETPGEAHWSRTVIEELAESLNQESEGLVHARLATTGAPEATKLVWGPITKLRDTATLLVVSGQGERAITLGPDQRLFGAREELEQYIVSLVASEPFRESLAEMMRRAREPTEGFFRSGHPHDRDPANDVFVAVPATVQKRLANVHLNPEAPPEVAGIRVHLLEPSPIAKARFEDRKNAIRWLVSGGITVALTPPLHADGAEVELSGTVHRDA